MGRARSRAHARRQARARRRRLAPGELRARRCRARARSRQALLDRGLSAERPVVILSDNDIEHLLLAPRRDARRRAVRADLAGVFARLAGLRQAAPHPRPAARPAWCSRAAPAYAQGDRRGRCRPTTPVVLTRRRDRRTRARGRSPICSRRAPTAGGRCRPRRGRPRHDRQVPLHLGLDQAAQGRDQHPAHAVREPADDPPVLPGAGRGAAGAGRLAALEPHLRRQPQRRHRRSTTAARSTSTRASRRRR